MLLESAAGPGPTVRLAETSRTGSEIGGAHAMATNDIRVATFDCYGTLVDGEGGLGAFLSQLALQHEGHPNDNGRALRERWEAIPFGLIQGAYRPYHAVLAERLRLWTEERGYPWHKPDGEALVRPMRSWQPFPDTRPALEQARQGGLRLVILSNTDNDIIAHTRRHLAIPFADVITAEDCGAYKPAPQNFERLLAQIGVAPEHALHVAFGFKYDIGPAQRLGMRTAWVNRHVAAAPGAERPDYTWRDLWGLAALAGGRAPAD
jgi:2-haloacid dehalogenase